MAAKKPQGAATSPLRSADVQGVHFNYDSTKSGNWKTFELYGTLADVDAKPIAKANAVFELIEYVTDITKDDVVAAAGGDDASIQDVLTLAIAIAAEFTPKN